MNRTVVSRLIPIFIAASVVMHCLPVQRRVVERVAFGANCHGESVADGAWESRSFRAPAGDATWEPAESHSHGQCICEAPNAPADRGTIQTSISVDIANFQIVDAIVSSSPNAVVSRMPMEPPHGSLPVGFVLPLLF